MREFLQFLTVIIVMSVYVICFPFIEIYRMLRSIYKYFCKRIYELKHRNFRNFIHEIFAISIKTVIYCILVPITLIAFCAPFLPLVLFADNLPPLVENIYKIWFCIGCVGPPGAGLAGGIYFLIVIGIMYPFFWTLFKLIEKRWIDL